jgi:integrase
VLVEQRQQGQQQQQEYSPLLQTFLYSIKSKETQKVYLNYLKYFQDFNKSNIEDLLILSLHPKSIEEILIRYIVFMREKGLAYQTILGRLSAVTAFLEVNDVTVNHKKLKRFMGENNKTIRDEAYTREDLSKMFEQATFRTRLIISIYSSTGIRKAALVDLKLKHIHKIKIDSLNQYIYKFTVYENSKDEYYTFCTPECASLIDTYLQQRRQVGEKINEEESWLIRNEFNYLEARQARNSRPTNVQALQIMISRLLEKIELRKINHSTENYQYKRHKKASFHAFRKYFNTCLANCDVNVTIKELLMGHSVGLDNSYFRPTQDKILSEYLKAVNELTINEENRLKKKVTELESKQTEIDQLKYKHDMEMKGINEQLDRLGSAFAKFSKANKLHQQLYEQDMKKYVPGYKPITEEQKEFIKKNCPNLFR